MQEAVGTGRLLGQFLRRLLWYEPVSLGSLARADSLRQMGNLDRAEALCVRVLACYPGYATAHVVLGDIRRDAGDLTAAEAAWREACRLHPEHPRANLRLAQLYMSRGELPRAVAALQVALLSNPDSPEAARLSRGLGVVSSAPPLAARPWLTQARQRALLAAAGECGCVTASRLITREGAVAARSYVGDTFPEQAGRPAATLLLESRYLLERLGAGALEGAVLQGSGRKLALMEVDGQCLLAEVAPQAPASCVRAELQKMVQEVREEWHAQESANA